MKIADTAVLVTGANRGLGRALVEEALRRGATRGYAGTRQSWIYPDGRAEMSWESIRSDDERQMQDDWRYRTLPAQRFHE